jgi:hypothetical protein
MALMTLVHELIEIEYKLWRTADRCGIKPVRREGDNGGVYGKGSIIAGFTCGSVYEQDAAGNQNQYGNRRASSSHGESGSAVLVKLPAHTAGLPGN